MLYRIEKAKALSNLKKSLNSPWVNASCFFIGAFVGVIAGVAIASAKSKCKSNACHCKSDEVDVYSDEDEEDLPF